MANRVFITGLGIASSIGISPDEVLSSLISGKSGIATLSLFDSVYKLEIPIAEVKYINQQLFDLIGVKSSPFHSRNTLLGLLAVKEAIKMAGFLDSDLSDFGLYSGTTSGGMDLSENFYRSFINNSKAGRLRDIIHHDCGDSTAVIAEELGIHGHVTTISTACSSAANAIMCGARLIKSGYIDRVIAGGVDALNQFTMNGFNSLMILDKQPCKPFDNNRNGLTLGEGAGFIILESERCINPTSNKILCELKGYGNACDAYHQTASSPDGKGAYLSMHKALENSGLDPSDITYINTHGTGTVNNDLSEGIAMERLFKKMPYYSSTKSYTGHTLGASGGIEAVISILSIINKKIFPGVQSTQQMNELKSSPVSKLIEDRNVNHILSNSFGFGGNNTSLVFSVC